MVVLLDGGGHQQVEVLGEALDDAQFLKTRTTLEYQPVRLGRDVDSAAEGIRVCGPPQRAALSDCARSTPSITASRSATPTATPTSRSPRPSRRNPTAQRNPRHHPSQPAAPGRRALSRPRQRNTRRQRTAPPPADGRSCPRKPPRTAKPPGKAPSGTPSGGFVSPRPRVSSGPLGGGGGI